MRKRQTEKLRVALVHYWLTTWGGGERVLRALADLFPQADIYAVVANDAIASRFADHKLTTSFVQRIPGSLRWHRHFLPLYPLALEQFDLRAYDLALAVLSVAVLLSRAKLALFEKATLFAAWLLPAYLMFVPPQSRRPG